MSLASLRGKLLKVAEVVEALAVEMSREGLSAYEKAMLVQRAERRLRSACWCDEGVCCSRHDFHSSPHQNCLLR